MVVYSIKDLESICGIKAHTIRIWEKRYKLVEPQRTKSNIRYYTDKELRTLLNICFLYRKGYKISKIALMNEALIKDKINNYSNLELDFEDQLDALMLFILELDSYNFNKVLDQHISQEGLEETMHRVLYPLLDKLSIAWLAGSFTGVHESFVTQVIKSKLLHAIEMIKEDSMDGPHYLIYLAPGEKQELSLLFLHFLLKKNNCKVTNLGSEISLNDLLLAITSLKSDYLFTIINEENPLMSMQTYVKHITEIMGDSKFLITGYQAVTAKVTWTDQIIPLKNLADSIEYIKKVKQKSKIRK